MAKMSGSYTVGRGGKLIPSKKNSGKGGGRKGDNNPLWLLVPLVLIGMGLGVSAVPHHQSVPSPGNPGPVTSYQIPHHKSGHHHCQLCLFQKH